MTFKAQEIKLGNFGFVAGAGVEMSEADVASWGLMRQFGKGGTFVVARLVDGRLVVVVRSAQDKAARKFIEKATAGLWCATPSPVSFAFAK